MKKILVTGSSGYIGSHLCKLLEKDYEVHGLDIVPPQIPVEHFTQTDITKTFAGSGEFDAVVHLAALINVGESQQKPISYYITNLNGTMNVINKIKTKNFVFASTGTAHGCASAYAISKRAAEDVVRSYAQMAGMDYTTFRFYNVIGSSVVLPGNPDGLIRKLIEAKNTGTFTIHGDCYGTRDGTCLKDYIHVDEVCHALRTAIEKPANKIECLGHGVGYTVKEMVDMFQKTNNTNFNVVVGPPRDGDEGVYVLDKISPYMTKLFPINELLRHKYTYD